MFFIKLSLSALVTFIREENVLMIFLLPNSYFLSLEIIDKVLAEELFIKATLFLMPKLTVSTLVDCNEY